MKHVALAIALLCIPTLAAADPAEPARVIADFLVDLHQLRERGAQSPDRARRDEADCHAAIQAAVRAGATRLYFGELEYYKPANWAKDARGAFILVDDAVRICEAYGGVKRALPAAAVLARSAQALRSLSLVTPEEVGDTYGAQSIAGAEACLATVDNALRDGAPADVALQIDGTPRTLAEGRVQICEAYRDRARAFAAASEAAHRAAIERFAAPYRALGVKGERLELFARQAAASATFYAAGCRAEILDDRKLVRARVLFQWLEGPDGTHTIRRFAIRGDTVRITEQTFDRRADAYKGCR